MPACQSAVQGKGIVNSHLAQEVAQKFARKETPPPGPSTEQPWSVMTPFDEKGQVPPDHLRTRRSASVSSDAYRDILLDEVGSRPKTLFSTPHPSRVATGNGGKHNTTPFDLQQRHPLDQAQPAPRPKVSGAESPTIPSHTSRQHKCVEAMHSAFLLYHASRRAWTWAS